MNLLKSKCISFLRKHKYFFLLSLILVGMCLILYRHYVFGGRLFLFEDLGSDSVRVLLPTYIFLFDWFRHGMPLWSDQMGIGTSVFSHAEVVFDPFTYILFILGRNGIIHMFIYMVIIKIILAGLFFWIFLGKYNNKFSAYSKIIGSITYALGGYMIIMGQNYVFSTIYVYLPLILFGFELWLQKRKSWLLILMLTITALYFYYFFYMTAIFFAAYALFRYFSIYDFNLKNFLKYMFSLFKFGVISLGLSAFYWLPYLSLTLNNLRVRPAFPGIEKLFLPQLGVVVTALGRFFGYDIFGAQKLNIYTGFNGDYFELALYCGIFLLILIPQLFNMKDGKERKVYFVFSIILALFLFIPFFVYIFNGFSDYTFRWTYILNFSLALLLAISVDIVFLKNRINYKILFGTACVLFLISFLVIFIIGLMGVYPNFSFRNDSSTSQVFVAFNGLLQHKQIFKDTVMGSFKAFLKDYVLISTYLLLIVLYFQTNFKKIIKVIILTIICAELITFPARNINDRITTFPDPVKFKLGYFDSTNNAIEYLDKIDSSYYRVDKSYDSVVSEYGYIPSDNDAMVQEYRGLKSYNGNNQPNYIRFIQSAGIFVKYPAPNWTNPEGFKPEDFHDANLNYINGVGNRYLLQSFLGVKYYLTKTKSIKLPNYYRYLTTVNNINIYKNNYYLPLGFTLDNYITFDQFAKLDNSKKDIALLSSVVVDDPKVLSGKIHKGDINQIKETLTENIGSLVNQRKIDQFKIISYKEDNIKGEINLKKFEVLVFTIPLDDGWSLYVDNNKSPPLKVDNGMMGVVLGPGAHSIELRYFPPKMIAGFIITILTILLILLLFLIKPFKKKPNKKNKPYSRYLKLEYDRFRNIINKVKIKITSIFRNKTKKSIFYICMMLAIIVFFLSGFITRGHSFYNLFVLDKNNSYMDFFNILRTLFDGPYTNHSIYPPLPLLIYKELLRLVPYDIAGKTALIIRSMQQGQIVFLFYSLITLLAFFILVVEAKKGSKIEKYFFIFTMLLSGPFLYQFERANIIFVSLLFLMIFVFLKDNKNRFAREFALFSLAISTGIKIYPVLFNLILIKEKRFKELLRSFVYSIALFILPFFFLGGINQLPILFQNVFKTSQGVLIWGVGYTVNILNITRIIFGLFGDFFSGKPIVVGGIISLIILVLGIMSSFLLGSKWKTVALLSLLMILVPTISYEYTLIFMIIPLIMFIDQKDKEKLHYFYLFCFILIFIPFVFGNVDLINKGFETRCIINGLGWGAVLPLTYGVLIQNIVLVVMAIALIIEGIMKTLIFLNKK